MAVAAAAATNATTRSPATLEHDEEDCEGQQRDDEVFSDRPEQQPVEPTIQWSGR